MQARFFDEMSAAAAEGRCAHSLAADLLYKPGTREKYVGVYKFDGVVVTDEIFDLAEAYVEEVTAYAGREAHVETRVSAPMIHLESYGTCDAWYYDAASKTLYVWEFKTGFGRVEAFENWQLINYCCGLLSAPGSPTSHAERAELVVVQPRDYGPSGPVKRWPCSVVNLAPRFARLKWAADNVFSEAPEIHTGSHCRYCRARHACEAARIAAFDAFDYSCEAIPRELDAEQLGRELEILTRAKEAIEFRYTGVTKQIETMIKQGAIVPQWELRAKSNRKEWTVSSDDLDKIAKQYEIELTKKVPITPKQAIEAGMPEYLAAMLTQTKPGKNYLTRYNASENGEKFKNAKGTK